MQETRTILRIREVESYNNQTKRASFRPRYKADDEEDAISMVQNFGYEVIDTGDFSDGFTSYNTIVRVIPPLELWEEWLFACKI